MTYQEIQEAAPTSPAQDPLSLWILKAGESSGASEAAGPPTGSPADRRSQLGPASLTRD